MRSVVFILLFFFSLHGADFDWIGSLQKGFGIAKKEKKPLMVMIEQKGCEACEYMDEVAFENSEAAEFIENFFVPVKLDLDSAKSEGLKAFGTPTFYFFTYDKKQIGRQLVGAATAENFLKVLKKYKKSAEKR